jgi:hypothetical protein
MVSRNSEATPPRYCSWPDRSAPTRQSSRPSRGVRFRRRLVPTQCYCCGNALWPSRAAHGAAAIEFNARKRGSRLVCPRMCLRHRFPDAFELEAARLLSRWKFLQALRPSGHARSRRSDHEHVLQEPALIVHADILSKLERIHAQVASGKTVRSTGSTEGQDVTDHIL